MRIIHLYTFLIFSSLFYVELNARRNTNRFQTNQQQPNILFLMVDQLRYTTKYEQEDVALQAWVRENLKTMTFLKDNGVNFDNHYVGSIACSPSRTTIFTGQYPTLHGVSQTSGAAKSSQDSTMYWLSPNSVPTLGNIFTAGNYITYYLGKCHFVNDDLFVPGTKNPVYTFNGNTGVPDKQLENVYRNANMLGAFGFNNNGWVGPEPHGSNPHLSGGSAAVGTTGRDVFFADEAVTLLNALNSAQQKEENPWFIVCSFVNPHDISLYGDVTKFQPTLNFDIDSSLDSITIDPAPTALEDLSTKPSAQASYHDQYQLAMQATTDTETYRKLYYSLQKKVDVELGRVLDTLLTSRFRNNTIVVFLSDHGELLGAHYNFQKWFNMYEESIHVPLIFYSPTLLPQGVHIDMITSHLDVLPTLCGLADINANKITTALQKSYTNSQALVGRDLSTLVENPSKAEIDRLKAPILFLTYDQIFTGSTTISGVGLTYASVDQPAFIDAIITEYGGNITAVRGDKFKLAQYYNNTSFATPLTCTCSTPISTSPLIEYEMYNVTVDPYEQDNLLSGSPSANALTIKSELLNLMIAQQARQYLRPVLSLPVYPPNPGPGA